MTTNESNASSIVSTLLPDNSCLMGVPFPGQKRTSVKGMRRKVEYLLTWLWIVLLQGSHEDFTLL